MLTYAAGFAVAAALRAAVILAVLAVVLRPSAAIAVAIEQAQRLCRRPAGPRR